MRRGALMKFLLVSAQTLPLYVSRPEGRAPPLCGAIPAESTYIARAGDIVAALVKIDSEDDSWILAEIMSYNATTNKYEVDDIDESKDRHVLSKRRVVPLPLMRANPETDEPALFPKGSLGKLSWLQAAATCFVWLATPNSYTSWLTFAFFKICLTVMALYPQTTCFYKAIVNNIPQTAAGDYELLFEDGTYNEGYSPPLFVSQRYVIEYRESKQRSASSWPNEASDLSTSSDWMEGALGDMNK